SLGTGAYRDFKIQSNPKLRLKDDLARRDLTINALAWDLKSKKLIDYFNGVNDLRAGIIRAVGQPKKRFLEDFSRMARVLRLATELNFTIERRTWNALKKLIRLLNKKKCGQFIVPRETLAKEFLKSFYADPLQAFEWWDASETFDVLIPEISALKLCAQPKIFHAEGSAEKHLHLALRALLSDDFKKEFGQSKIPLYVSLGVLFHDIGKPKTKTKKSPRNPRITFPAHAQIGAKMTRQIVKKLKLESYKAADIDIEAKKLSWLVENHMFILKNDPKEARWTTIEQYFMQKDFPKDYLLQMSFCDIEGSRMGARIANLYQLHYLGYKERMWKLARRFPQGLPKKLISGDDIKRVLKIGPGPKIAQALDLLREEQLAGKIKTKSQALAFLKNIEIK
ncbi:HD domain-containing protein, partial [Patescibacteria group bacterium]|nr:HD domain-containing protein [Patescibacteria group bacterium]